MDFFGIGAPELVLILLVFFIFLGPTKLPEIAGMMGKAMRKLKQASAEMNRNLKEVSDEIKETGKETPGDCLGRQRAGHRAQGCLQGAGRCRPGRQGLHQDPSGLKKDLKEDSQGNLLRRPGDPPSLNPNREKSRRTPAKRAGPEGLFREKYVVGHRGSLLSRKRCRRSSCRESEGVPRSQICCPPKIGGPGGLTLWPAGQGDGSRR